MKLMILEKIRVIRTCSSSPRHAASVYYDLQIPLSQHIFFITMLRSLFVIVLVVLSSAHLVNSFQSSTYRLGGYRTSRLGIGVWSSAVNAGSNEYVVLPPDADARTKNAPKRVIRPLTQNWWPVSLVSALEKSKPNPVELLGKKLVLWFDNKAGDNGEGGWSCLDDRCAHRFAPLSEGRVVITNTSSGPSSCLQCSYHGWEFDGNGGCNRIPQATNGGGKTMSNKLSCSVQSYPTLEVLGMIWVWADTDAEPKYADEHPLRRTSDLLQRFHEAGGTARGFQRDLPYGFELLGENLVDVSHLPFSHHSVGTLNRDDGRPVPLEMLSEDAKIDTAISQNNRGGSLPIYQARVVNAAEHDPEIVAALKYNPDVKSVADPKLATSTVGFYEPCHVRYHRNQGISGSSYEVNLFMCPTTEGNSRVFLFTPIEKFLPKEDVMPKEDVQEYRPSGLMLRSAIKLSRRKKSARFPAHAGHMIAHAIFDGDGIFLNMQGDRMKRSNLKHGDYHTPTSADIMVNAFRRWLDKAVDMTRAAGSEQAASVALGDGEDVYKNKRTRAELLDRYMSHTAKCKMCLAALKTLTAKRDRLSLASTALLGATGASGLLLVCTSMFLIFTTVLIREPSHRHTIAKVACTAICSSLLAAAASFAGVKETAKQRAVLDKEIQQFYFEDYIHSEKE
jgi:pheophorbide a oxygenase